MKSTDLLAEIEKNISLGRVPQTLLGQKTSADRSEHQLATEADFKRYLESLQPQIENALQGLGIGCYGAVREISRVRRENLALRLLPGMLPLLSSAQASTVIRELFKSSSK